MYATTLLYSASLSKTRQLADLYCLPGRRRSTGFGWHRNEMAENIGNFTIRSRVKAGDFGIDHVTRLVQAPKNHIGVPVAKGVAGAELDEVPRLPWCLRSMQFRSAPYPITATDTKLRLGAGVFRLTRRWRSASKATTIDGHSCKRHPHSRTPRSADLKPDAHSLSRQPHRGLLKPPVVSGSMGEGPSGPSPS